MTRPLGKGEVESSILSCSTIKSLENIAFCDGAGPGHCAGLRVNMPGTVAGNWQGHLGGYDEVRDLWPGYDEPTALYRYFSETGGLLYVGISNNFLKRDAAHFAKCEWRRFSAFVRVEVYPTRDLAEIAESHAIEREEPEFNAKWPAAHDPHGRKRDWYLAKMGGLRGECARWAVTGCEWPASATRCGPPTWWDDARLFFIPYSGGKPKRLPKQGPKEAPCDADSIVWGAR